ncbi:MAG: DUF6465 family protein [Lachnospiraceae bacterium]|nr:DUF6465 family protein [Lachnospiraceae bacterium]
MPTTKTAAKKTAAKGASKAKKASSAKVINSNSIKSTVVLQYAEKSIPYDDLVARVKDIWMNQFGRKLIEINNVDLYIKPEENKVYYVINNDTQGDFDL